LTRSAAGYNLIDLLFRLENFMDYSFLNPNLMVDLTSNNAMRDVAQDASAHVHRVCDALPAQSS
jgi:hypothetical protein